LPFVDFSFCIGRAVTAQIAIILTSPVAGESPPSAGSLCPAPHDPLPERLKNDLLLPAKIRFVSLLAPARSGT
jgi:hypothetical protein